MLSELVSPLREKLSTQQVRLRRSMKMLSIFIHVTRNVALTLLSTCRHPALYFSQLSAVVYLFSKHVHDPTLPLATQTLAVRVLLHLVDSICRNASSEEGLQQVGLIGFQLFVYVSCQISYKREVKTSKGRVRGDCAMKRNTLLVFSSLGPSSSGLDLANLGGEIWIAACLPS